MLQVKPVQLHFTRGEKGKPQLISSEVNKSAGFNVSHQVSAFPLVFVETHFNTCML